MTFGAIVPFGGLSGWHFLKSTKDAQLNAFSESSQSQRQTQYFKDNIGSAVTAEQLVGDRRLLEVALSAFGLEQDIGNRAFIRQVLESDTLDRRSLASRLSDKRYFELAKTFGFGDFATPNTVLSDFADKVTNRYFNQKFEEAIGSQDPDLRLAHGLERNLRETIEDSASENTNWFSILGTPPLRVVFARSLGLPDSISALDIDRQVGIFKKRTAQIFGVEDLMSFHEKANQEKLLARFFVNSESSRPSVLGSKGTALALLQSSN